MTIMARKFGTLKTDFRKPSDGEQETNEEARRWVAKQFDDYTFDKIEEEYLYE